MNIFFRTALCCMIVISQPTECKKKKIGHDKKFRKNQLIKKKHRKKTNYSHIPKSKTNVPSENSGQIKKNIEPYHQNCPKPQDNLNHQKNLQCPENLNLSKEKFEELSIDERLEVIAKEATEEFHQKINPEHRKLIEKKIVIVTPSYKNAQWHKYNLKSVFSQNYSNYRIIYIDDCSPDNTANLVENFIREEYQEHRVKLIKNKTRNLALKNLYNAIISCEDDEIVAILDGDDMLAHANVLSRLNNAYANPNVWMTYGNCRFLSTGETCGWSMPMPDDVVKENKFREWQHGQTHIRTFYAGLFKKVNVEDLKYEDEFFKMTYDVAMFMPMIEMAGERHLFIKDVLYVYNDMNVINDHKVDKKLQEFLNTHIRQKTKYARIDRR